MKKPYYIIYWKRESNIPKHRDPKVDIYEKLEGNYTLRHRIYHSDKVERLNLLNVLPDFVESRNNTFYFLRAEECNSNELMEKFPHIFFD